MINGAENDAQALSLAKIGSGQYVNAQIASAFQQALLADREVARKVAVLSAPRLSYTLASPVQLLPNSWQIGFEVFVNERP